MTILCSFCFCLLKEDIGVADRLADKMKTSDRSVNVKVDETLATPVIETIIDLSHYELEETTEGQAYWKLTLASGKQISSQLHVMVKYQLKSLEILDIFNWLKN